MSVLCRSFKLAASREYFCVSTNTNKHYLQLKISFVLKIQNRIKTDIKKHDWIPRD